MSGTRIKSVFSALTLLILILSSCRSNILHDRSQTTPQYIEITQLGFADVHTMTWNDSQLLAFASSSTRVYSQLTGTDNLIPESIGSSNDIEWNPDGEWLAGVGSTVWLWRNDGMVMVLAPLEETRYYNGIAWSPEGDKLAVAGSGLPDFGDQNVWIWDVDTGELIDSISIVDFPDVMGISSEIGFSDVQWDSSGTLLSMSTVSGRIVVWNLAKGEPFSATWNDESYPNDIKFSPHSNDLALIFSDVGLVEIRDTISGRMINSLEITKYDLTSVVWHPRKRVIGIIGGASFLSWNIKEAQYQRLLGFDKDILSVEWLEAIGVFLATESGVYLWNEEVNNLLLRLNNSPIRNFSVDASGTIVAVNNERGIYLFGDNRQVE